MTSSINNNTMYWKEKISKTSSPSITPNELLEILLSHTYGYYVLPQEPYDECYENIFIGDSTTALCIHLLKRLGITHVLNAAWGRQRHLGLVNTSSTFYRNAQIEFMGIEALDMSAFPLYQHFYQAANFIDIAVKNGKILVHCGEGISRSSTLVIAYLMIKKSMTVSDAIRTVVKHRNILPNQGFLLQLCQLNDELFGKSKNFLQQNEINDKNEIKLIESKPPMMNNNYSSSSSSSSNSSGGNQRTPTPNSSLSLSPTPSCFSYSSSNYNSNSNSSSRSPTPLIGYFTTNNLNNQQNQQQYRSFNRSSSRSSTPGPYTSVSDYEKIFTIDSANNYYPKNYSNSIRPIKNRLLMQRRMDFRRARSVERPNYITKGSSYLNKISSYNNSSSNKSRSQFNLTNTNNFGQTQTSLMTTYLTNRPLPTLSR